MEEKRAIGLVVSEELAKVIEKEGQKYERKLSAQVRLILKDWAENLEGKEG